MSLPFNLRESGMVYKDMTFCGLRMCTKFDKCERALTEKVIEGANYWWMDMLGDPPISIFAEPPECYSLNEKDMNKDLK